MARFPIRGTGAAEAEVLFGSVTIGAAGAISSSYLPGGWATVVKTAAKTGRYSFTMNRKGYQHMVVVPNIEGPADVAIGNASGNDIFARNVNAGAGTFDLQAVLGSTGADTDITSGNKIHFMCYADDYTGP